MLHPFLRRSCFSQAVLQVALAANVSFCLPSSFAAKSQAKPTSARVPAREPGPRATLEEDGVQFERKVVDGATFQIAWINPKKAKLRLRWKRADEKPLESIEAARSDVDEAGERFFFATNSGIYDRAFEPLGLHVEDGRELKRLNRTRGPRGNFFMQPNGVFFVRRDGTPGVLETAAYAQAKPDVAHASQSGPLLLARGELNPNFRTESENRKLRSGVGVDARGFAAFAISEGRVRFHQFASLFRDALACPDALYFDGEISSMLKERDVALQFAPYVGIWVASGAVKR